jgi:hypothetical protein
MERAASSVRGVPCCAITGSAVSVKAATVHSIVRIVIGMSLLGLNELSAALDETPHAFVLERLEVFMLRSPLLGVIPKSLCKTIDPALLQFRTSGLGGHAVILQRLFDAVEPPRF